MAVKRLGASGLSTGISRSSKIWDQETTMGSYESIATAIVDASGASSITFSNIPQQYKHLQIRVTSFTSQAFSNTFLTFNGDTGANYTIHQIVGNGSSASAYGAGSQNYMTLGQQGTSTYPGVDIIDILDYASTSKYKTVRSLSGADSNGTDQNLIIMRSGVWFKAGNGVTSDAVTSITLANYGGSFNYTQYSHFALYGIRG